MLYLAQKRIRQREGEREREREGGKAQAATTNPPLCGSQSHEGPLRSKRTPTHRSPMHYCHHPLQAFYETHNNNLRRATSTGSSPLWNVDAAPCSVSGEECSFLPSPADCATSIEQACGFQWHCPPWVWCTSTITEGLRRQGRPEEDHLLLLLAGLFMYVRPLRRVLLW